LDQIRTKHLEKIYGKKFGDENFVTEAYEEFLACGHLNELEFLCWTTRKEFIEIAKKEKIFEVDTKN
jgi:hypothetical protein